MLAGCGGPFSTSGQPGPESTCVYGERLLRWWLWRKGESGTRQTLSSAWHGLRRALRSEWLRTALAPSAALTLVDCLSLALACIMKFPLSAHFGPLDRTCTDAISARIMMCTYDGMPCIDYLCLPWDIMPTNVWQDVRLMTCTCPSSLE